MPMCLPMYRVVTCHRADHVCLVGPVLYGYRDATALRAAIEHTLAGR